MDGGAAVAGLGPLIELGGRSFQVRGRNVDFGHAIEAEIISLRGNPTYLIVEAARSLKTEKDGPAMISFVAQEVAEKFRNWRFATYQDYAEFLRTPRGDAFQVWYAVKEGAADVTLDQIQHWMRELRWKEGGDAKYQTIMQAIDFASGEDELGNSNGRPSPAALPAAASTGA